MPELPRLGGDGWESLYLDGEWKTTAERFTIEDPYEREGIASVSKATEDTVDEAYEVAANAQREWEQIQPQRRAEVIQEAIGVIEERHEELVELLAREAGGTRLKAEIELDIATGMMEVAAGFPFDSAGQHDRSTIPGKENVVKREPVGVVGVISPWNFPFHLSMRAVAPALALGNAVVLKPASDTPVTGGLALARIFEEAGLPEGLLNVVPGRGSEIGDRVAGHEIPRVIAFTGSTPVGRGVASQAAEALSMPAMELGGNNAHIVLEDADLDQAVNAGAFGSFVHQGQVCISINRHLVHESLYDDYVAALADKAQSLPVGDPKDGDTVVGPIINESQRDQMIEYIEETVNEGATLEAGGEFDGLVVEPTVLSGVENDMAAACNEHFGPVAPVIPFADDEEAISLANATEYGLSGSVHSTDRERAERVADRVDTGMIHINDQPINDEPHIPFGGVGASGIGRYNGEAIKEELTTTKWISIQREEREYPF
ncbi:aldehyde dehydrogenase family protein [Halalkalicoccus jeotgali]|uniref:aldehyde dehydrogenase n=1 Tax=Halalkalicoccus jeotgali (strain DSM 18796 / CECT 7217 / JCM 14584 / KCTC 4019 / B3) TaxID=795797 RepID=D8J4N1_HALJB|nr:aldehyde dehydrogenase family protein [Halalkalicoccus jeotgali]ADJ15498.1 Aldehyde Dehydrogenase [Halalkalicoccus jeotgali B3]ELY36093.1 aldehyde dehydrogenase [Halalkalicoccus jeotgali B3]